MPFTDVWDATFESAPQASEDARLGAERITDLKLAVRERMEIEHSWAGDANDGKHNFGYFTTGDVKITLKTTPDTGWIIADDGSIGDASSAATNRANADTSALFTLLWNNTANAQCPVSGGRGASAAADFAAHKTLTIPRTLGRALSVAGLGSGLTNHALAFYGGSETNALTTTELPAHNHAVNDPGHAHTIYHADGPGNTIGNPYTADGEYTGQQRQLNTTTSSTGITTQNTGSGGSFSIMQPCVFFNVMIKL